MLLCAMMRQKAIKLSVFYFKNAYGTVHLIVKIKFIVNKERHLDSYSSSIGTNAAMSLK